MSKKEPMKPVSTGMYKCVNCHNDIILESNCPVCGRTLRGFFFELEEWALIQKFLGLKATNKVSFFYFNKLLMYELIDGAGPKRAAKSKSTAKKAPKKAKVVKNKKLDF